MVYFGTAGVERKVRLEEEALTELLRYHNSSIPYRKGRVITATYLYKNHKYAMVDTGFKQVSYIGFSHIGCGGFCLQVWLSIVSQVHWHHG